MQRCAISWDFSHRSMKGSGMFAVAGLVAAVVLMTAMEGRTQSKQSQAVVGRYILNSYQQVPLDTPVPGNPSGITVTRGVIELLSSGNATASIVQYYGTFRGSINEVVFCCPALIEWRVEGCINKPLFIPNNPSGYGHLYRHATMAQQGMVR
jgi:hypothetical protein